ncbi:hypothetical protein quinque_009217 [Culex quinquefasciatus]
MLAVFWQTLDPKMPKFQLSESLIGANPGLGFRPMPVEDTVESTLVWYKASDNGNIEAWTRQIDIFLKAYHEEEDNRVDCSFDTPPPEGKVCRVPMNEWGPCTKANRYNFKKKSPCIFLKLNKIFNWVPDLYNTTENLPEVMPEDLREHIGSELGRGDKNANIVWVSCAGENPADNEHIGPINYIPRRGFPGYFFPFKNTEGYLPPIVAVHFESPKTAHSISDDQNGHRGLTQLPATLATIRIMLNALLRRSSNRSLPIQQAVFPGCKSGMILRAVASANSMFPDGSTADELVNSLQRKMLYEQAVEPAVQQFVQSVCPIILRSMSVLSETVAGAKQFSAPPPQQSVANSLFPGGSTTTEQSNSLQQIQPLATSGTSRSRSRFFALEVTTVEATTPEVSTTEFTTESLKESLRKPRRRKTEPTRSNKIFQRKLNQWSPQQSVANSLFPGGSTATKQSNSLQQIQPLTTSWTSRRRGRPRSLRQEFVSWKLN